MARKDKVFPIELELFAPNSLEASVSGSFSDWEDIPLEKGEDGHFRTRLELPDGRHTYRFQVRSKSWFHEPDQWVTVIDPYATDVDAEAECAVLHTRDGFRIVDTFEWRHDSAPLPSDRDLVIYELHVGDFSGGEADPFQRGTFDDVTQKLDYLADLGVNAIEMMPVKEFPGTHGWGYNPRYFMAAESTYGATDRLKHLIDQCHARGMRVIMDGVYNHSDTGAPLALIDHDYWYHHDPKDPAMSWGPEFNYGFYDERLKVWPARQYIGDVVRYWIREFHIDGIRYDAAKQIDSFDFLGWIVSETRKTAAAKPFYNVAEYIPSDPAVCGPDGPMDGCWHEPFLHAVTAAMLGEADFESLKNALDARRAGFVGAVSVVNYFGNHDHERVLVRLGERGILGPEAFQRVRLGVAMLMTAVGIPMLWMGDEFGVSSPKTVDRNKIDWQLLANADNQGLREYVRDLIHFRKARPALRSDDLAFIHEDVEGGVLAYLRWSADAPGGVVTVLNLSGNHLPGYRVTGFPSDGTWREWRNAFDVDVRDGSAELDLPPYEACLLVME